MDFVEAMQQHLKWVDDVHDTIAKQGTNLEILSDALIRIYNETKYAGGASKAAQINNIAYSALQDAGYLK